MNQINYRDIRNEATKAQRLADTFVHLTTEAALNQAAGLPDDPTLPATLTQIGAQLEETIAAATINLGKTS